MGESTSIEATETVRSTCDIEVASAYGADDQTQNASPAVQRHVCNDIALRRSLRRCHRDLAFAGVV